MPQFDLLVDPQKVRQLRMTLGWTQPDLATRAGISKGTISNLERGRRPSLRTVRWVAEALRVRVQDLLLNPPANGALSAE
jgi:transcriptional regulator with XRE-family HTH domain